MKLRYTGPRPTDGTVIPLPQGWPAESHEEPDEESAKEKVESGHYEAETSTGRGRSRASTPPAETDNPAADEGEGDN